jgi:hypothetical protein
MDKYLFELDDISNNLMNEFKNTKEMQFYTDFDSAADKVLSNYSKSSHYA